MNGMVLAAVLGASAAPALAADVSGAERLRRLDIMLEVGAQRCEGGAQDYEQDYRRFAAEHRRELKQAEGELRQNLVASYGKRAAREMERQGTAIANFYGQGHPWLDCAQLGMVARNLAQVVGRPTLEEAADQLIRPPAAAARMASIR